jgi:hypothetical protein
MMPTTHGTVLLTLAGSQPVRVGVGLESQEMDDVNE